MHPTHTRIKCQSIRVPVRQSDLSSARFTRIVERFENMSDFRNQDGAVFWHSDQNLDPLQQTLLSAGVVAAKAEGK